MGGNDVSSQRGQEQEGFVANFAKQVVVGQNLESSIYRLEFATRSRIPATAISSGDYKCAQPYTQHTDQTRESLTCTNARALNNSHNAHSMQRTQRRNHHGRTRVPRMYFQQ